MLDHCILNKVIVISENEFNNCSAHLRKYVMFVNLEKIIDNALKILNKYDEYYDNIYGNMNLNDIIEYNNNQFNDSIQNMMKCSNM